MSICNNNFVKESKIMTFVRVVYSNGREALLNSEKILSISKSAVKCVDEDDFDFEIMEINKISFKTGKILGGSGLPIKSNDGKLIKVLKFLNNKEIT